MLTCFNRFPVYDILNVLLNRYMRLILLRNLDQVHSHVISTVRALY